MNILMLGGTTFLGIHMTEALRRRGHRVTHFTRRTMGDRRTDLARTGTQTWDGVIDNCGYHPRDVEISARYFANRTGRYVFTSTISVYDASAPALDEDSLQTINEPYGSGKAACERVVVSTFRQRALVLRPGLIAGPYDPTDRFTYWPRRFARGGEILAPESAAFATQVIDARDIADFTARALERDLGGTYNLTSSPGTITLGDVFDACRDVSRLSSTVRWASAEFLSDQGVGAWVDMPLWIPATAGLPGMLNVAVRRALIASLTYRPLRETVRDTLAWHLTCAQRLPLLAGLSVACERELLLALHADT
ncbi:MAG: NAD-dependent epimerase/dehydratase family protein [Candidatus Eremiobacteraeota bacterium]|nr:NAD-dependent epimerase/dehydratase family protein [Candidatus Eremiobacteraeota bacterium]